MTPAFEGHMGVPGNSGDIQEDEQQAENDIAKHEPRAFSAVKRPHAYSQAQVFVGGNS